MTGDALELRIVEARLDRADHERDVVALTAAYALDEMGNAGPLRPEVLERLVPALREHPTTIIFLAYVGDEAVGIATCFLGFSTFAARPLLNVHDLAVRPEHRRRGVGRALLAAVEAHARARGCVKLTLEVGQHNRRAREVYDAAGFAQAMADERPGGALFYIKALCLLLAATALVGTLGCDPIRSVNGRVVDPAGRPVAGARIKRWPTNPASWVTDERGCFQTASFYPTCPETIHLWARAAGYKPFDGSVQACANPWVELVMVPAESLDRGRLREGVEAAECRGRRSTLQDDAPAPATGGP